MLSYEYIRREQDKAARRAAREGLFPYSPASHELANDEELFEALRAIPFIGDYVPKGWEFIEGWTVDASGFGAPDEPALTQDQFLVRVRAELAKHPNTGFAITESGQFQVFVGVYRYTGKGRSKRDHTPTETRGGWTA